MRERYEANPVEPPIIKDVIGTSYFVEVVLFLEVNNFGHCELYFIAGEAVLF